MPGIAQSQHFLFPLIIETCTLAGRGATHAERQGLPSFPIPRGRRQGRQAGGHFRLARAVAGAPGRACLRRQDSAAGHQDARLLLSVFLGPECHFLESSFLRDARSEWALENCRGLWRWGARGSHTPGCKACGGGVPSGISNYRSYFCPADYVVLALGMRNETSHY